MVHSVLVIEREASFKLCAAELLFSFLKVKIKKAGLCLQTILGFLTENLNKMN